MRGGGGARGPADRIHPRDVFSRTSSEVGRLFLLLFRTSSSPLWVFLIWRYRVGGAFTSALGGKEGKLLSHKTTPLSQRASKSRLLWRCGSCLAEMSLLQCQENSGAF